MYQGNSNNWRETADWISSREQQSSQQKPLLSPPRGNTFSGNTLQPRGGIESSDSEAEGSGNEKRRHSLNGTTPRMGPIPTTSIPRKPVVMGVEQRQPQQQSQAPSGAPQKKRRMSQVPQDPRMKPRPSTPHRDTQPTPAAAVPSTSVPFSSFAQYVKPPSNIFCKPRPVVEPTSVKAPFSPTYHNEDTCSNSSERSSMTRMPQQEQWPPASGSSSRFSGGTNTNATAFGSAQQVMQQQRGPKSTQVPSSSTYHHHHQQQPPPKEESQNKKRRERSTTNERQPQPGTASARKKIFSEIAPLNGRPSTSAARSSKLSHSTVQVLCPPDAYKAMADKQTETDKLVRLLEYENDMFKSVCLKYNLPCIHNDPVTEKINAYKRKYL